MASALESFLVEEVPANAPDYDLMGPLGADTVVEFVIQDFGMRSDDGHAGAYLKGYGRMFRRGRPQELWRRPFDVDAVELGRAAPGSVQGRQGPGAVPPGHDGPAGQVADMFVKDLTPTNRKGAAPTGNTAPDTVPSAVTPPRPRPPRPSASCPRASCRIRKWRPEPAGA